MSCPLNQGLRIIAINTRPLWTRISVHDPKDLPLAIEMMERLLIRSGTLPLDISVRLFRITRFRTHEQKFFSGCCDTCQVKLPPRQDDQNLGTVCA